MRTATLGHPEAIRRRRGRFARRRRSVGHRLLLVRHHLRPPGTSVHAVPSSTRYLRPPGTFVHPAPPSPRAPTVNLPLENFRTFPPSHLPTPSRPIIMLLLQDRLQFVDEVADIGELAIDTGESHVGNLVELAKVLHHQLA